MGDFHWGNGWFFSRQENGDVEVTKRLVGPFVIMERFTIPAMEWASIIASVSALGETGETYDFAKALHAGEVIVTATGRS